MALPACPKCGHPAAAEAASCTNCGREMKTGAAPPAATGGRNGTVPAEVSEWIRYETPPEVLARARQSFNEAEFLAEVRQIEETGGVRFEDFIEELEEELRRRE